MTPCTLAVRYCLQIALYTSSNSSIKSLSFKNIHNRSRTLKHTAIYLRVSSKAQDTRSQEPDLERFAASQDGSIQWYRDKATGKSMDRPGWVKLEEAIRQGKVSAVVVWRVDRLGRTARGLTALFEDFQQRKINLISLKDGLDLSTSAGRLMAHILASVAQYETEVRGERVKAGQTVARDQGKRWGGSKAGIRKVVTDEQLRTILRMRAEKEPISTISRVVGLSRPTVYVLLRPKTSVTSESPALRR
jgi:DNA invertase Pin-like site-specific DNA recombinase